MFPRITMLDRILIHPLTDAGLLDNFDLSRIVRNYLIVITLFKKTQ
jgi:hypothetical protein